MREGATYKPFDDCFDKIKTPKGVPSKDYLESGTYPVISQEEEFISGYNNDDSKLLHIPRPVVIFGDHSRVIKYVDFDFVLGADGVKVLLPKVECDAKYIYYFLKHFNVPSLGYSRHFKLLREAQIPVPSLSTQELIVRELDSISSVISAKKQQVLELDNLAQAIFLDTFGDPITNPKGWEVKKMSEACDEIFAGGDVPKGDSVHEKDAEHTIPIYSNGVKDEGLYGYTSKARVLSPAVTISGRGTIGAAFIRREPFFPIIRLIVAIPNKSLDLSYFGSSIKMLSLESTGNSIQQLTIPMIKEYTIPIPPLSLQQAFAEKVQVIEEQKRLINQSIAEFESLLAQRMEFHFA